MRQTKPGTGGPKAQHDARREPSPARSAERERQDHTIQRASRESWITQLLRSLHLSKGRPKPGAHQKQPPSAGT